jgi:hypothetical protein
VGAAIVTLAEIFFGSGMTGPTSVPDSEATRIEDFRHCRTVEEMKGSLSSSFDPGHTYGPHLGQRRGRPA